MNNSTPPKLSIIVIFFNMRREAARTLYSLSTRYQQSVSEDEYQVIAIDNNSSAPLSTEMVESFGSNFEYHYYETDSSSPAAAINFGIKIATGEYIACIVDGARMLSPGIIWHNLMSTRMFEAPFIIALAWHLGPDVQNQSMLDGYDQLEEDRILTESQWRTNGYNLFDISTLAQSSGVGWLRGLPEECSWFSMRRSSFLQMGGFDERFRSKGGGLVNHDFLQRISSSSTFDFVLLLGEGSFHQFHGGVATNVRPAEHPWESFIREYEGIRGEPFKELRQPSDQKVYYFGRMPKQVHKHFLC